MAVIGNPIRPDRIIAVTGETVKVKIIDIGDWNMRVTGTGDKSKDVIHGLAFKTIFNIQGYIRNDTDSLYYVIGAPHNIGVVPADFDVMVLFWDSTKIRLNTVGAGGYFDTTAFDSTSYNRGKLIIFFAD